MNDATFNRMEGIVRTDYQNQFEQSYYHLMCDLQNDGFEKDEIVLFFKTLCDKMYESLNRDAQQNDEQRDIYNQVTKNKAQKIANEHFLSDWFVDFICRRFPNEYDESYIDEWARRFKKGNAHCFMDKQTKSIYIKLISQN